MTAIVTEQTIRPAAVVPVDAAARILAALEQRDVSRGGVWNATPGLWQRYDRPWDGPLGTRGGALLVGSIAVVYDRPRRNEITVYKATLTTDAYAVGWTTERLCDDALFYAGITLATCPRDALANTPPPDPFASMPRQRGVLHADVGELLRTDVRELFRRR